MLAAFLCLMWPRANWVWIIIAAGCALARVRYERHFFTDVVAGGAFGWLFAHWVMSWNWPITLGCRLLGPRRVVLPRPGGEPLAGQRQSSPRTFVPPRQSRFRRRTPVASGFPSPTAIREKVSPPMALIVQKFGGDALGDKGKGRSGADDDLSGASLFVEKFRHVAEIVMRAHNRGDRVVVVVSAMGDSTNRLLRWPRRWVATRPPVSSTC